MRVQGSGEEGGTRWDENQRLNNYPSASVPEEYALPQIRSTQRGSLSGWLPSGSFLPAAAPPHSQSTLSNAA